MRLRSPPSFCLEPADTLGFLLGAVVSVLLLRLWERVRRPPRRGGGFTRACSPGTGNAGPGGASGNHAGPATEAQGAGRSFAAGPRTPLVGISSPDEHALEEFEGLGAHPLEAKALRRTPGRGLPQTAAESFVPLETLEGPS